MAGCCSCTWPVESPDESDGVWFSGWPFKYRRFSNSEELQENESEDTNMMESCKYVNCMKKSRKMVKKRLPFLTWVPKYNLEKAIYDVVAGFTVGMMVIPQGIAYAGLAGLPAAYGLYSALCGGFVYCLLGSTNHITIGPVSILALMTSQVTSGWPDAGLAILLAFFSGIVTLVFGLLKLGALLDLISYPVIAGFVSAANLKIAILQLKPLLGIRIARGRRIHLQLGVLDGIMEMVDNIDTVRYQDAIMGFSCASLLLLLRALGRRKWFKPSKNETVTGIRRLMNKLPTSVLACVDRTVWFLCTSRNALVVVFCLLFTMFMDSDCVDYMNDVKNNITSNGSCTFRITGEVQTGLPKFQPPEFEAYVDGEHYNFLGLVDKLGTAIIIVPLISIIELVALAKAFSKDKPVDASQEMIALGVANIVGSFFGSMPTTASFSRTAVNAASGARSPLCGIMTGSVILLCLAFLMPYCAFIPKATLAAVIITSVIFSIEYEAVLPIWRANKLDLVPGVICFLVCLFYSRLEFGILVGAVIQIGILLYQNARPSLYPSVEKTISGETEYILLSPQQAINFPAANYVRHQISHEVRQGIPVVVDCTKINCIDFTAAKGFKDVIAEAKSRNVPIYWLSPNDVVTHAIRSLAKEDFRPINSLADLNAGLESDLSKELTTPLLQNGDTILQNGDANMQNGDVSKNNVNHQNDIP